MMLMADHIRSIRVTFDANTSAVGAAEGVLITPSRPNRVYWRFLLIITRTYDKCILLTRCGLVIQKRDKAMDDKVKCKGEHVPARAKSCWSGVNARWWMGFLLRFTNLCWNSTTL